jgi:hypothetical protein
MMKQRHTAILAEENPNFLELGRRRTDGFLDLWIARQKMPNASGCLNMSLQDLISSAYLQGVRDAFQTVINKQMLKE